MKLLRTSFSHLVREKVISGLNQLWPEPADVPVENLINHVSAHTGNFEYQEDNHTELDLTNGSFFNQGAMGYGEPPAGPGTKPYVSYLSNKVYNTQADDTGIYTGDPSITPSITLKDVHFSGFGATFAIGQAEQYRFTADSGNLDCQCAIGKHILVSIGGLKGAPGDYAAAGFSTNPGERLDLVYETTGELSFSVYVQRGDGTVVTTPQTYNHPVSTYGRLMPIHVTLNESGVGSFRVDSSVTTFDIRTMVDPNELNYKMPTSGWLNVRFNGLDPTPSITAFGMTGAISRLTNLAVNDNDASDGCHTTVGLPPFIHGVPATPIRRAAEYGDAGWEFPLSVVDSTDSWSAFSENNPEVEYGLNAIMDNQTFDLRGVATTACSADLDIQLSKDAIDSRINGAATTNSVEAVNFKLYNAATFNNSEIAMKLHDADDRWRTDWTSFPGIYDDPSIDSHVSFYCKSPTKAYIASDAGTVTGTLVGSPDNLFDGNNTTYYGRDNTIGEYSISLQLEFAQPFENVDTTQWVFEVDECCGGRHVSYRNAQTGQWHSYDGPSAWGVHVVDVSLEQPMDIDAVRMVYGGRNTFGLYFRNYQLKFISQGQTLPLPPPDPVTQTYPPIPIRYTDFDQNMVLKLRAQNCPF
jgi:hypothetical protein